MNKSSIVGIVLVALIFVGFTYYNSKQQEKYRLQMMAYEEEQAQSRGGLDSLDANGVAATDTLAHTEPLLDPQAQEQLRMQNEIGDALTSAATAEAETVSVENDVMRIDFSTRGGQITGVTLKDYTKYAPRRERHELVQLFDPATARFDLNFYVKHGFNNVRVSTTDYTFRAEPVRRADGVHTVVMTLPVSETASLRYEYLIYDTETPQRDYLVDLNIYFDGMAPQMANQTSVGIEWANRSYQNEKGFKNENMYTTVSYRHPGEKSIDDLGMGDGDRSKKVSTSLNWMAFKQQFFSSVLIAYDDFSYGDMKFSTEEPESGYIKDFSLQTALPYNAQIESYRLGFYFGPNKYAILRKVTAPDGGKLALERLVPLGWGIFGWVNRWFVIPVFDFLRQFIANFGLIILILSILVKLIISPLTYKSYVSTAKMRVIKPEVDALTKKYPKKEDAMKRQQATMELYKKAGINPMGGCIPMLIQMPIIIAMFRFFPASIELRDQSFLWADDLSSYDSIVNLPFNIPFYGDHVSLFALLMAVALFAFSYINYQQTASSQPQMAGMKFMMVYMMPVMMLFWFNNYSSGLCYYYFLANVITIGQTLVIRRMIDDQKIHATMQANAAKNQNRRKSKFQLRYEEMMRQQETVQKQKGRK